MRISFTPGAAVATKSRLLASGPMRASSGMRSWSLRYSWSDSSVSIVMANRPGTTSRGSKAVGPDLEDVGEVALGVDLDEQRALAPAGGEQAEGGGDAGLADPALARDEQQPAIEQLEVAAHEAGGEARFGADAQPAPKPIRRSLSGLPSST